MKMYDTRRSSAPGQRPPLRALRRLLLPLGVLFLATLLAGCTLIRYRDGDDGGDVVTLEPKVVDVLVLVDLDRSAANLAPAYHQILASLFAGLGLQEIAVRKAALAPMYRRAAGVVPLLYGEGDPGSEFGSFGEAIGFYTYDDGARYLQDATDADGENLAVLGMELDRRAIYRPTTADPEARAYFEEAADGFVVVYLTASERRCAADNAACQLDGLSPGAYVTDKTAEGAASWLDLPGDDDLAPGRIFHLAITTAEGIDYDTFARNCERQPNFPSTMLDVMEPSSRRYFGPFTEDIRRRGGKATTADLCQAMSSRGELLAVSLASQIRSMF